MDDNWMIHSICIMVFPLTARHLTVNDFGFWFLLFHIVPANPPTNWPSNPALLLCQWYRCWWLHPIVDHEWYIVISQATEQPITSQDAAGLRNPIFFSAGHHWVAVCCAGEGNMLVLCAVMASCSWFWAQQIRENNRHQLGTWLLLTHDQLDIP